MRLKKFDVVELVDENKATIFVVNKNDYHAEIVEREKR